MAFQNKITLLIPAMRKHIVGKGVAPVDSEDLKRLCETAAHNPISAEMNKTITTLLAQAAFKGIVIVPTVTFLTVLDEAEQAVKANPGLDDYSA